MQDVAGHWRDTASDSPPPGEVGQQSFTGQCIHIRLHAALVFIRPTSTGFYLGLVARLRSRRRLAFGRGLARCTLELERDTWWGGVRRGVRIVHAVWVPKEMG